MNESYSARVKEALCRKTAREFGFAASERESARDCCKLSFFTALLLYACEEGAEGTVRFAKKDRALADLFATAAAAFYSLSPTVTDTHLFLKHDAAFERVLRAADLTVDEGRLCGLPLPVCADCLGMFLRGAFLARGTMGDPKTSHQLNLALGKAASELLPLLTDAGIPFRLASRRSKDYLYLKKASDIEDFLARIGAQSFAMQLMDSDMERGMRSLINRQNNFDTANLSRSAHLLSRLDHAIEDLTSRGRTENLPENLKILVRLRRAHPDDSLRELGERLVPRLSKSGLYHRVRKLIVLSEHKEV